MRINSILTTVLFSQFVTCSTLLSSKPAITDKESLTNSVIKTRTATEAEFREFCNKNLKIYSQSSALPINFNFELTMKTLKDYPKLGKIEQLRNYPIVLENLFLLTHLTNNFFNQEIQGLGVWETSISKSVLVNREPLEAYYRHMIGITTPIINLIIDQKKIAPEQKAFMLIQEKAEFDKIVLGVLKLDSCYFFYFGYYNQSTNISKHSQAFGNDAFSRGLSKFQNCVLTCGHEIIKDSGLIINYRKLSNNLTDYIRVQAYYGENSSNPFTIFQTTVNIPPEMDLHKSLSMQLNDYISESPDRSIVSHYFIPMPNLNAQNECALIQYIIVEQWLDEWNQCEKQEKKYRIEPSQLAELDYLLITLKPDENSLRELDFKTKAETVLQCLKSTVCEQIMLEQQACTKAVSEGKVVGKLKHKVENKGGKNKGKKKKTTNAKSKTTPDHGFTDQIKKSDKFDLDAAFNQFKVDTNLRYRGIIKIFQEIDKFESDVKSDTTPLIVQGSSSKVSNTNQKGSHITFHDSLGNFTLVRRHGHRVESQPHEVNALIMRRLQGLQHSLGL